MINRVILQGRLTKNPEINYTPNGNAFTDFSIAVECGRKKNGDRITNFFKIEAWSGTAEFICKYFEKGQQIISVCFFLPKRLEIPINSRVSG